MEKEKDQKGQSGSGQNAVAQKDQNKTGNERKGSDRSGTTDTKEWQDSGNGKATNENPSKNSSGTNQESPTYKDRQKQEQNNNGGGQNALNQKDQGNVKNKKNDSKSAETTDMMEKGSAGKDNVTNEHPPRNTLDLNSNESNWSGQVPIKQKDQKSDKRKDSDSSEKIDPKEGENVGNDTVTSEKPSDSNRRSTVTEKHQKPKEDENKTPGNEENSQANTRMGGEERTETSGSERTQSTGTNLSDQPIVNSNNPDAPNLNKKD